MFATALLPDHLAMGCERHLELPHAGTSVIPMSTLIERTRSGLYCTRGDFYIDPSYPVKRALITHAHADHARYGCRQYLASEESEHLLRLRMNRDAEFSFLRFGESISIGGVTVSFHPAGHILGSAQIRLEHRGYVVVVTGDYKLEADPTCTPWEPVPCNHLITESTFGLPVFRWPAQEQVQASINQWWRENQASDRCSILYGYAVGKSQRILAGLDPTIGEIFTHGAVEKGIDAYRASGIELPMTTHVAQADPKQDYRGAMILAVPGAHGTPWMRKFGSCRTAMASGWTMVRGWRRRRSMDQGFVISDHIDWSGLLEAIHQSGAEKIWVDHGYSEVVARYLNEMGRHAISIDNRSRSSEEDPAEENPNDNTTTTADLEEGKLTDAESST